MERLTERRDGWVMRNGCHGPCRTCHVAGCADISTIIECLAAYEDTGLTPEEIMALIPLPKDPLTLEELLEMDGEPVWVEIPTGRVAEWCISKFDPLMNRVRFWCSGGGWFDGRNVGKSLFVYRRRPEEGTT